MNRIGIVGLGAQATSYHLPGILNCADVELVAICDQDSYRANEWASNLGVEGFVDARLMLSESNLDFVILAVPHDQYLPLLYLAAEAGVNVLKDKPFARCLDEGQEIADRFVAADRCIITHVQRRLTPHYVLAKRLLPELGDVFWAELRYTLFTDPHLGWRGSRRRAGGGCVIDMGYHMLDLILWYLGMPSTVHAMMGSRGLAGAMYDVEDSAQILYSYGDQGVGTCLLSRRSAPKSESIRIMGTAGSLDITPTGLEHRSPSGETLGSYRACATANHIDVACAIFRDKAHYSDITTAHLQHLALVEACYTSARLNKGVNPGAFIK